MKLIYLKQLLTSILTIDDLENEKKLTKITEAIEIIDQEIEKNRKKLYNSLKRKYENTEK